MNLLPVLGPIDRVSRGVLVGSGDEDLELLGPGRFGPRRRLFKIRRAGSMTSLGREKAAIRIARMQRGQVYAVMPSRFQRVASVSDFDAGLTGFEMDGLGRLRLGKRLRKVVKSKAFKIAAIAAAAYFTGGAALKFAAPALKKLAASKLAKRIGSGVGKAGPLLAAAGGPSPAEAAQPWNYEQPGTLYPQTTPWYGGGGGGGYSGGGEEIPQDVYAPGEEQPEGAAPVQLAGMGGSMPLLIGGGLVLAMLAGGGGGSRRRRRR